MKKFLFIGIGFSKSYFDVSVLANIDDAKIPYFHFENVESGYKSFLRWLSQQSKISSVQ